MICQYTLKPSINSILYSHLVQFELVKLVKSTI